MRRTAGVVAADWAWVSLPPGRPGYVRGLRFTLTDDPSSHRGDTGHRFLARLGNVLRREGRSLGASLRDPVLGGLLLLSLLLAALACQIKVPFVLDVGQRPDEVYLTGFHAAQQGEGQTYRWSTGEARLLIPGLGSTPYHLDLVIDAARESGQAPPLLRLEVAGRPLLQEVIQPGFRSYSILLPPEALRQGTLDLGLRSDTVTSTRDSRPLGVALERVKVRPAGSFLVLPPWPLLLWAVLTVLLAVLLARRLGWSRWPALGMGTVVALALAASLAWARPLLAPGMPFLPLGFAAAWAAVVVAQGMVRSLFARGGAELDPRAERALWSIAALFLVVRLAGSLHPALATWGLCFHWHRLGLVARGQVLFTILSGGSGVGWRPSTCPRCTLCWPPSGPFSGAGWPSSRWPVFSWTPRPRYSSPTLPAGCWGGGRWPAWPPCST